MRHIKTLSQIGALILFSSPLAYAASTLEAPSADEPDAFAIRDAHVSLSQLTLAQLSQQPLSNSIDKKPNYFLGPSKKNNSLDKKFGWSEGDDVQYAIFRSGGDIYLKGRAGYLTDYTQQSFEDISLEEVVNEFDKHGALGLGAGYTLKNGTKLEFDYTITKRAEQILQVEYLF